MTITGTVDVDVTEDDTLLRKVAHKELREEVGLETNVDHFIEIPPFTATQNKIYFLDVKHCEIYKHDPDAPPLYVKATSDEQKRLPKQKVIIALVGTRRQLYELLSKSRDRSPADNEKDMYNIDGIVLRKMSHFAELYRKISK
jgi:hypothetical protein